MKFVFTHNISLVWSEINSKQKKIKSSWKEYAIWSCFKFLPMKNIFRKLKTNERLIMACLQIYRELLSIATFLRVHSNSKEVSCLSWENTYPNLKATFHIKLKLFLWTKRLENLLLAKYLISVATPLTTNTSWKIPGFCVSRPQPWLWPTAQFVFDDPGLNLYFPATDPRFVFTSPG